jgi:hypothetical protein
VRHAGSDSLDGIETFLVQLRDLPGVVEKKRGVFYRRSKAFIHFHEDPTGMYADVRLADEFDRFRVQTPDEQDALLARIRAVVTTTRSGR